MATLVMTHGHPVEQLATKTAVKMEGVKIAKGSYLFMKSVRGGEAERSTGNTFLLKKKGWGLVFSYYIFYG